MRYATERGLPNPRFFVDDGISGTTFDRPGFQEMERMIEAGENKTVVVKDLSRFGRNYIEMGNYLEIKYPSLGVQFLTLQENVDTSSGAGLEMMPFHNIFNEWYAAQISKKIRAVWKFKADKGERVSSAVPYSYKKSDIDPKQWVVDEEPAKVVKQIFDLGMEGLGPMKIANRLQEQRILTTTAKSIDRPYANKNTTNPFGWEQTMVRHILENRQYTGCTVNFKLSIVSYKVHKKIDNEEDDWQIMPNSQEAIIDEETFMPIKELRNSRRRNTATGRTSLFWGLVYCGDCGSKLYFCAAKSVKENQEFFRCSAYYKENRGTYSIHFIRNVVLEEMVLDTVKAAAKYVCEFEPVFLHLYAKNHDLSRAKNLKAAKQKLEQSKKRILELDKLTKSAFEQRVLYGMEADVYDQMLSDYQAEKKDLLSFVETEELRLSEAEQDKVDLHSFLTNIRKCSDTTELTPSLVNTLIKKIDVFDSVMIDGKKHVPIKVHFILAGIIDIPNEKELLSAIDEMRGKADKSA